MHQLDIARIHHRLDDENDLYKVCRSLQPDASLQTLIEAAQEPSLVQSTPPVTASETTHQAESIPPRFDSRLKISIAQNR